MVSTLWKTISNNFQYTQLKLKFILWWSNEDGYERDFKTRKILEQLTTTFENILYVNAL